MGKVIGLRAFILVIAMASSLALAQLPGSDNGKFVQVTGDPTSWRYESRPRSVSAYVNRPDLVSIWDTCSRCPGRPLNANGTDPCAPCAPQVLTDIARFCTPPPPGPNTQATCRQPIYNALFRNTWFITNSSDNPITVAVRSWRPGDAQYTQGIALYQRSACDPFGATNTTWKMATALAPAPPSNLPANGIFIWERSNGLLPPAPLPANGPSNLPRGIWVPMQPKTQLAIKYGVENIPASWTSGAIWPNATARWPGGVRLKVNDNDDGDWNDYAIEVRVETALDATTTAPFVMSPTSPLHPDNMRIDQVCAGLRYQVQDLPLPSHYQRR